MDERYNSKSKKPIGKQAVRSILSAATLAMASLAADGPDAGPDVPAGSHWLLVITKTPAKFWVHGGLKLFPAHNVILYRPSKKSITGPAPVHSSTTGSASNPMNRTQFQPELQRILHRLSAPDLVQQTVGNLFPG
ncbi:hypothetical protein [Paenibacillus sp. IHB B 3415]|uniref:hypothetical protein n=1 Tax=Paenibacillus sp. IHB B 3415 TaxID=867080 RepID=UPI00057C3EEF|nr:hypothetical protein [Paenibacillus sp. IHB B 3415]